jgi:tripartite ATP-independent transporter DctP family solute receptor
MVMFLTLCDYASAADRKGDVVQIAFAHNLAIDSVLDKAAKKFADEAASRSKGKVKITVYPAGQLGNERDMLEGIQIGTIDMMLATTAYVSNLQPEFGLLDLPFIFRSREHVKSCFDGEAGKYLFDTLLKGQGLRIMDYWDSGFRVMLTKSAPLTSLADFKGRAIRAPEVPVYIKMFEALGASPTPIPFGEVYTSIQTGIVDGVEVSAEMIYSSKFYEVGAYIALTNHIYTTVVPVIGEKLYQSLHDDVKTILNESMKAATAYEWGAFAESDANSLQKMIDAGIKVNEIDREELKKACLPMYNTTAQTANARNLLEILQK